MTAGVVKSQNTRIYFAVAGTSSEIHMVQCATAVNGLNSGQAGQIETTCLSSAEKEFVRGLLNPGPVNIPFNTIFRSAAFQALQTLKDSGETASFMVVFSDQSNAPNNVNSDGKLVSPGATSYEFSAYIADMPLDANTDDIVRGTLNLQRSGAGVWDMPAADLP